MNKRGMGRAEMKLEWADNEGKHGTQRGEDGVHANGDTEAQLN